MALLSDDRIRELLTPFVAPSVLTDPRIAQLSTYLDLLVRWNARVSLTAIRQPEEIVQRHFGESLFTAAHLATRLREDATLLDYGSGAGFPGLPIQLVLPNLRITLAESQAKKVAFLREVIRNLGLNTTVWSHRAEDLPETTRFNAVTLRAVDRMTVSLESAAKLVNTEGWLAALVGRNAKSTGAEEFGIPESEHRKLVMRQIVPRGTFAV